MYQWIITFFLFRAFHLSTKRVLSTKELQEPTASIVWYYIVITIVEHDTGKYHKFTAEYCYECEAQVIIPKAMNKWCFLGIAFYYMYGNNEYTCIVQQTCRMIGSYVATPPGNKKSISNVASSSNCPAIKWMSKKPTAEWSSRKQSQWDVLDNKSRIDVTRQHNEELGGCHQRLFCPKYSSYHR